MAIRKEDLRGSALAQALAALAEINGKKTASGLRLPGSRAQLPQYPPLATSAQKHKTKARRGDGMSDGEASLLGQLRMAGLPKPETQVTFALDALGRKWRFEGGWRDAMVAYEVDGGHWSGGGHVRGAGFAKDCLKLSEAAAMGWRILRFTTPMVDDGTALRLVEKALGRG